MRILIIHSNGRFRGTLRQLLEALSYTVDPANDFTAGARLSTANKYHLAIIEHSHLNDAASFSTILRKKGKILPILVLLAEDDGELGTMCLDAGADDFLRPPIDIPELMARIRSLLRRPQTWLSDQITVGPLQIDLLKQSLMIGSREVRLSRREYDVLEILAIRNGGIVTKEEIIEHIWGNDRDETFDNALQTHIHSLRKKLGSRYKDLLQTEINRGYRLG